MRVLALLLLAGAAAADHEIVELACPDAVLYRVQRDLDGDGLDDLVVVTGTEAWAWSGRADGWAGAKPRKLALPEGTALFDVSPKGFGLVVRTAEAYLAADFGASPRRLAASGPGLPKRPANVLWRGFYRDFDGDGAIDLLDVSLDGYRIDYAHGAPQTLPPFVKESARTHGAAASERFVARFALGEWTTGDFDGDGKTDFAVLIPTGLWVVPGDGRRFVEEDAFELAFEEAQGADLTFRDLNGDGKTDVVAVRRKAGQASVLVAGEGGLRGARRTRLALPGEMRYPVVDDFTGDGRPDLALPFLPKPTVQDAVRVVARGEFLVKVPIFVNTGGADCIPQRAAHTVTVPIRVRIAADEAGRLKLSGLVVVEYGGDLDGDGRKDLLVTERPDLLAVHRGVPDGVFEDEASLRLPIPDSAAYDSVKSAAADLNGDGLSDIILHYRGAGRRPDRLLLLLSRKKPD